MDEIPGTQSVSRAFALVDLVAEEPRSLQVLCHLSGLTRPTAARLLSALEQHRYIRRSDEGDYELGVRFLELASRLQHRLDLPSLASPYLDGLVQRFGETTFLCERDGQEMVCVATVESPQALRLAYAVGTRTPLHAGALGKVLLAFAPDSVVEAVLSGPLERLTANTIVRPAELRTVLEAIRSEGYSESDGEGIEGASAVAAPVRNASSEVVAAISVSGPSPRVDALRKKDLRQAVMETGEAISADLGWVNGSQSAESFGANSR